MCDSVNQTRLPVRRSPIGLSTSGQQSYRGRPCGLAASRTRAFKNLFKFVSQLSIAPRRVWSITATQHPLLQHNTHYCSTTPTTNVHTHLLPHIQRAL